MDRFDRLIRDVSDGILIVDSKGTILHINPAASVILGMGRSFCGKKYSAMMMADREENHDFHRILIDAVLNKSVLHRENMDIVRTDGKVTSVEVTSSWSKGESEDEPDCVIITIVDRSDEIQLKKKLDDSSFLYSCFLCIICLWAFITAIWNFLGQPISGTILSKILAVVLLAVVIPAKKHTNFTWKDFGLRTENLKHNIITDTVISAVAIVLLCLVKLIILKVKPEFFAGSTGFVSWRKYPLSEYILYIFSVLCQEFVTRGIVHEIFKYILNGKNNRRAAILVSSLVFGAMHMHLGFVYMIGAAVLLGALGLLYDKQKSIWGLCIPHYVLGMAIGLLDFVVY